MMKLRMLNADPFDMEAQQLIAKVWGQTKLLLTLVNCRCKCESHLSPVCLSVLNVGANNFYFCVQEIEH